jgi:hypothetical protein
MRRRFIQLAQACVDALRRLIEHCISDGTGSYTPSDFPEASSGQADLDKLIAQIASIIGECCKWNVENIDDIYDLSPVQLGLSFIRSTPWI